MSAEPASERDQLLHALATDDEQRSRFVETLRSAAALLEGIGPESAFEETTRIKVAFQQAMRLREVAQKLCDHGRVENGICRYCARAVRPA